MRNEVLAEAGVLRQVDGRRENRVENKSLVVSEPASDISCFTVWGIGEDPSARLARCMPHFEECRDVYDIAGEVYPHPSRVEEEC